MKVLVTDPVDEILINILREKGYDVSYMPSISHSELLDVVQNVNILVVRSRTKVMRDVIDKAKSLKLIARVGVGLDNIDVEYARSRGIEVINAGAATAQSVAELTIGLMIGLLRKIYFGYERLRKGEWVKRKIRGLELHEKTLGIIGVGNIGSRVGKIAYYGFGMRVLGYRRRLNLVEKPIVPTDLNTLLRESDIISVHLPLTPQTRKFIDREKLDMMKNGVFIINTSRMEILDIDAILDGLRNGKIGGFAADTNLKPEHPKVSELLSHPNVLLTPHIGAQTIEAQRRAAEFIAQSIIERLPP